MRLLLDRGAEINAADADGFTALHVASIEEQLEAVRFLLGRGARKDVRAKDGSLASDLAKGEIAALFQASVKP
ncbi:MAG: hypothetical protein FD126_2454 [Elusimicrobia bacterium]|nr:MAG: hypothetical protein FD126_2454 [Elusimicrobiota bacterium]